MPTTLPPGQSQTSRFPVVGEKAPPAEALDLESWELQIAGLAHRDPLRLRYHEILALPREELVADIHCVTSWSQLEMRFTGVRLLTALNSLSAVPEDGTGFVRFEAYSSRRHDTTLPLELALSDAWLIHSFDGKPLTPSRGFPLRVVTPSRYFYKSLKWVRLIEFIESDSPGFWERTSGYHHNGDPWSEERLEATRFTSKRDADAFRNLEHFGAWRVDATENDQQRVIVKADFRGWNPKTRDLKGLHLKACDFRNAQLQSTDCTKANFTLGKFQGACLRNARFVDADLEGADFRGADLTNCTFERSFLSAARFSPLKAWSGLIIIEPGGLLEDEKRYLRGIGALDPTTE